MLVALFSDLNSQSIVTLPFDWSNHNGVLFHDGILLSNQSWASGILQFDGSQSAYPYRYDGKLQNHIHITEVGELPKFSTLPDSTASQSYFDYVRGDYGLDILDLGINYLKKNNFLKLGAFKRSSMGNFAHYVHPVNANNPIHQSYRVDYSNYNKDERIELSAGRYLTKSGLPDELQNGYENDNIISTALRYQKKDDLWTYNLYASQSSQHRSLMHSIYTDSIAHFVNRTAIEFQIKHYRGYQLGLSHKLSHFNRDSFNRPLKWSSIYLMKNYDKISFLGGAQFSKNDLYQPFVFSATYLDSSSIGKIKIASYGESRPAHPGLSTVKNKFENRLRSSVFYDFNFKSLFIQSYVTSITLKADTLYNNTFSYVGTNATYAFNANWKIYIKIFSSLSSSIENKFGTKIESGLFGMTKLFEGNMIASLHIWLDHYQNTTSYFSYDPFLQFQLNDQNKNYKIAGRDIVNFDLEANVSGVLLNLKIFNVLNFVDSSRSTFKPIALYPQIGRMLQFGVTWYFEN